MLDVLSSTPARAKRLASRPDGPLTHFTSPRGEKRRLGPLRSFDTRGPKSNLVAMRDDLKSVRPCLVLISAISDDCFLWMRNRQVVSKKILIEEDGSA